MCPAQGQPSRPNAADSGPPRLYSGALPGRLHVGLPGQIDVAWRQHPAMPVVTLDTHYGLEIGVIVDGTMHREFPGHTMEVGPGQVYITGLWEPHGWAVRRKTCSLIHIAFLPEIIADVRFDEAPDFSPMALFAAPANRRPQMPRDPDGPLVQLARQMLALQRSGRPRYTLWLRSMLLQFILVLYEHWEKPVPADPGRQDLAGSLNPALQLVLARHSFISISQAAKACRLSSKAFARAFARLMGTSFPKFALRYRFQGAARQLLNSDDPVKMVAGQWGFTDASHLHRLFLEYFGCTPSEYRTRIRSFTLNERDPSRLPLPEGTPPTGDGRGARLDQPGAGLPAHLGQRLR